MSEQGKRTDVEQVMEMIQQGAEWKECAEAMPGTVSRMNGFVKDYIAECQVPRDKAPVTAIMYYGPPGTGKTWTARERYPDAYEWDPEKEWQSYKGQDVVIFDEVDPTSFPFKTWLKMFQPGPFGVRQLYKRGELLAHTFILTTNTPPEEWFKNHPHVGAWRRRVRVERFNQVHPEAQAALDAYASV